MNETQRSALDALMTGYFQFGLDDLEDSKVDISDALVERAYGDTLADILALDPGKGEETKAKVKTLFNEMINEKVDFEREGLDMWYKCMSEVIEEYYQDAGLTDENPMTIELAQKWINMILNDLSIVVDLASLDEDLKGSYSFLYYKEFVETFRDCFPPVA